MKGNNSWLVVAMWLVSWLLIFWINFSAELSLVMHFVATPLLLMCSAASAGFYLESTRDADIAASSDPAGKNKASSRLSSIAGNVLSRQ